MRMEIPLAGSDTWTKETKGAVTLAQVRGIGFTFDSWESDPFTLWLDGIAFE
jgi:hypothetical protein